MGTGTGMGMGMGGIGGVQSIVREPRSAFSCLVHILTGWLDGWMVRWMVVSFQ